MTEFSSIQVRIDHGITFVKLHHRRKKLSIDDVIRAALIAHEEAGSGKKFGNHIRAEDYITFIFKDKTTLDLMEESL